jgi:8-oxo-dGTP diphosphatase
MKIIDVTCAIISIEDKILVVQRGEKMQLPLKWEFPGGKIEKGESAEDCVRREIKEELDIEIELISSLIPSKFHYIGFSIQLFPFLAKCIKGEIKLTEHKQYLLLKKNELKSLDWAEADIPVLNEYLRL